MTPRTAKSGASKTSAVSAAVEEAAKDLSGYVNVVGIAHALFEIEKSEGPEGAQDLIDEIITGMSSEEVNGFMALVARELRRLSKKYKEENK